MYDALILAGGSARRLGGADKPGMIVGGATLLDRVLAAVPDAARIVVVGTRRPVATPVDWCVEQPPGGGPVAAIAAGLPRTSAETILLLAADLPGVAPAVPRLLSALAAGVGATLLTDRSGRPNHLAAAWRRSALAQALAGIGAPQGVAVRRLSEWVRTAHVPDLEGWGRDCDTWDDLASARAALSMSDAGGANKWHASPHGRTE